MHKTARAVEVVACTVAELETWEPREPVRLIALSNVFENIVDPERILCILKSRPSGFLPIETPNPIFARCVSLFHSYVYSRHAIGALLARMGFDVVAHESKGQEQRFLA